VKYIAIIVADDFVKFFPRLHAIPIGDRKIKEAKTMKDASLVQLAYRGSVIEIWKHYPKRIQIK
jgi:hypothetical protein